MKKWKRREGIDTTPERHLITGMIISTRFLKEVKAILKLELLQVPFVKIVATWCLDYYDKHKDCPGRTIEDMFNHNRRNNKIEDIQAELIEEFLTSLSNEYEHSKHFNVPYILEQVETYLKGRALIALTEDIFTAIAVGDIPMAESMVANFRKVTRFTVKGADLLRDKEKIIKAIDRQDEDILLELPGELGRFIGPMCRGDLAVASGQAKSGKSFWLEEIGVRSLLEGLKVVWFSFEMTEEQLFRRVHQNFTAQPLKPEVVYLPIFDCLNNQMGECESKKRRSKADLIGEDEELITDPIKAPQDYAPCTICRNHYKHKYKKAIWYKILDKEGLSSAKAVKKAQEIDRLCRGGRLHLACFPTHALSVDDCEIYLDNLEYYENFIGDVIIFDYAKLMISKDKKLEFRHRIDDIWQGLRSLAQKRHVLVVSADHAATKTIGKRIKQGQQQEDNRLINHVVQLFGLNQTEEEKAKGVMIVNILASRFEDFNPKDEITVLECKKIGRPYLDSMR